MNDHAKNRRRTARFLDAYVALSFRRAWTILLVALALAALSLLLGRRVELDAQIESLLPSDSASARAIRELRQRTSSDAPLYLLVQSSQPERNRELAARLRDAVASWPDTEWAISRRDPSFFLERRLLYLPTSELDALADRVEQIVEYEECALLPGCVNLDERPKDPTEREIAERLERVPEVAALSSLFGSRDLSDSVPASGSAAGSAQSGGELCSSDGKVCAVQAVLRGNPLDLQYAAHVNARVEALFAEVRQGAVPVDLVLAVSGRYRDAPETQRVVSGDLAKTLLLSTGLLLLVLLPFFRGVRPLVVLGVPLLASMSFTLGALSLLHPRLNLISAFTLAVLAGVGVDFGIHLLSRFSATHDETPDVRAALRATLRHLFGPMVMAAVTTAAGFLALYPARFRGFSEMGVICAGGILLTFATYWLLGPALLAVVTRGRGASKGLARSFPSLERLAGPAPWLLRTIVLAGVFASLVLGVIGYRGLAFEDDFRRLRPPTAGHHIPWGRALHGTQRNAVYLMADDPDTLETVAEVLRREGAEGLVHDARPFLISPRSFVPAEQGERLAALARLRRATEEAARLKPGLVQLERIESLLSVSVPITPEDLPSWVRGWFVERDGRFGNLAVLFTDLSGSRLEQMELLSRRLDEYRERFPGVRFASGVALLGEVVPGLRRDAPLILGLATLGLSLAVLLVRRSLRRLVVVLVPLVLSAAISMGLVVLLGLRINFYNLLVFPLAIGMGIDGSIYITEAVLDSASPRESWTACRAVLGATLTTLAGFAALLAAKNPGLVSLAHVALVTMGSTLVVNLGWLPLALTLLERKRQSR